MSIPPTVIDLVERFERNIESYKFGNYNEQQTRYEFINPFFEALGWDVSNKQGYAEAYKDVVHEYSLKTSDTTEAPDYLFRIGGTRKFFVEAKKPSIKLADDTYPAYQLRRYAWTAKLPLSILTDFEEFAVYDCRIKPNKNDKPSVARVNYYTYKDYIEKWEEIASVFSKDSVLKGSFDKYAEINKAKRGTAEVDDAFLKEIEHWRDILAKNIAIRNPKLTNRELNFAVQKTIDRIIFLRICEDRGIEDYGQLMSLQNGVNVYIRMMQIFNRADEKYNSGLFHFEDEKGRIEPPDIITPKLTIDDKTLKDIIKNLYYPESPYEFSVLPADILGHVYEQFLGKVIRLTPSHQAKIDEKPEVKKAGGVYYTPTYIVDYIVKNTVGKLLEDKTHNQVAKLRILDPACGSGSFLLGAYQYLLDWHLQYYLANQTQFLKKGKVEPLSQNSKGEWKLTTAERKRILLNNIYGVDIDPQAVEVTKLSLLLKVLEGETDETLASQMRFFHERALPDLSNNIKCGNSLIGPDFYDQTKLPFIDDEERIRINVFDWNEEFKDIMSGGGFDVVIGNPPYVLGRETFDQLEKDYFAKNYSSYGGKFDLYIYFTERGIYLLNTFGRLGFILPNTILANENALKLRKLILENTLIENLKSFEEKVFRKASVENVIVLLNNNNNGKNHHTIQINGGKFVSQSALLCSTDFKFNISLDDEANTLIKKIEIKSSTLGVLTDICIGIQLGGSHGSNTKESFLSQKLITTHYKKVLDGKEINRYYLKWSGNYVNYGDWLHRKRKDKYFINEKIMIRQIGATPIATYDNSSYYTLNTIYNVINDSTLSLKYFLAVINSRLGQWYWRKMNSDFKNLFPKIKKTQIASVPIYDIDFSNSEKVNSYKEIIQYVDLMLELIQKLSNKKTPQEKESHQRQINATNKQIDKLVYQLYGLTEEEIKIVEGE